MAPTKPKAEPESPAERAFRHGNVKREAVLLVLDSTMSDARKLAYLRAWVTDTAMQPVAKPVHDWSTVPAYSVLQFPPYVGVGS